jgi:UDP-glucose 4-epimerase
MNVLVTGAAGYIGSHVSLALEEAGFQTILLDQRQTVNLESLHGTFVQGDYGDTPFLEEVFAKHAIEAIVHLAAFVVVPESVENPLAYYENNVAKMIPLLRMAIRYHVKAFLFSSSAAVYGAPTSERMDETAPLLPINPYGATKMMGERLLSDTAKAGHCKYGILRYFNVAGADPQGRCGQVSAQSTHLIKVACETALGMRDHLDIYGEDYPTPDGSCVRDYIHVSDLAAAHLLVLEKLLQDEESLLLNCGYGHGYSVKEVVHQVKVVSGVDFPVMHKPRRLGDPAALVADNQRIRALGWQPKFDSLETIVQTALAWEAKHNRFLTPSWQYS